MDIGFQLFPQKKTARIFKSGERSSQENGASGSLPIQRAG
jgi:hypothetical protein